MIVQQEEHMCRFALIIILLAGLTTAADKPNIVFFIADDVSQEDFGCYGHKVIKTPHTDTLAANGMRFDNAYLTTSSCSPTRCSIITGRYPKASAPPAARCPVPQPKPPLSTIRGRSDTRSNVKLPKETIWNRTT